VQRILASYVPLSLLPIRKKFTPTIVNKPDSSGSPETFSVRAKADGGTEVPMKN